MKESKNLQNQNDVYSAEELYDKYFHLLFSIITKIIPDNKNAEEALVEAFIYLHKNLSTFNPTRNTIQIWVMNNARNIATDKLCRMQQNDPYLENLKKLTLAEKTVFALYHFRQYSVNQIVEVLYLSGSVVEKLLQSAEAKAKK